MARSDITQARSAITQQRRVVRHRPFASQIIAATGRFITIPQADWSNTVGGWCEVEFQLPSKITPSGTLWSQGNTGDINPYRTLKWGGTNNQNLVYVKRNDGATATATVTFTEFAFSPTKKYNIRVADDIVDGVVRLWVDGDLVASKAITSTGTLTLNVTGLGVLARTTNAATSTNNFSLYRACSTMITTSESDKLFYENEVPSCVTEELLFTDGAGATITATIGTDGAINGVQNWITATMWKERTAITQARTAIV